MGKFTELFDKIKDSMITKEVVELFEKGTFDLILKGEVAFEEGWLNKKLVNKLDLPREVEDVDIEVREGHLRINLKVIKFLQTTKVSVDFVIDEISFKEAKVVIRPIDKIKLEGSSLFTETLTKFAMFIFTSITNQSLDEKVYNQIPNAIYSNGLLQINLSEITEFKKLCDLEVLTVKPFHFVIIKSIRYSNKKIIVSASENLPANVRELVRVVRE